MEPHKHRTWVTTPNIAVIKYWGKRDAAAMAPLNSSLSIALCADTLRTFTTATAATTPDADDELELNGQRVAHNTPAYTRFARCLACLRATPGARQGVRLLVRSRNSFPTGAGVASSASGLAGVAVACADALGVPVRSPAVAHAARMGSGSACRSCLGGFVLWRCDPALNPGAGGAAAAEAACVEQVAAAAHWPDLRLAVLLATTHEKRVGSTAGMQQSVATSDLLAARVARVPAYIEAASAAVRARDIAALATCAMRDSNQLHAVCLDTYPPLVYMTDSGHALCALVHAANTVAGRVVVGYTFDAGPNPVLLAEKHHMPVVLELVQRFFPGTPTATSGKEEEEDARDKELEVALLSEEGTRRVAQEAGLTQWHEERAFASVLVSAVGAGPFAVVGDVTEDDCTLLSRPKSA